MPKSVCVLMLRCFQLLHRGDNSPRISIRNICQLNPELSQKSLKSAIKCFKEQNINITQSLYPYLMVNI